MISPLDSRIALLMHVLLWLGFVAGGGFLGDRKGRLGLGLLMGAFLGPIGWLIVLLCPRRRIIRYEFNPRRDEHYFDCARYANLPAALNLDGLSAAERALSPPHAWEPMPAHRYIRPVRDDDLAEFVETHFPDTDFLTWQAELLALCVQSMGLPANCHRRQPDPERDAQEE